VVGRLGTLTDNTLAKTRFSGIMLVDTERGHSSSPASSHTSVKLEWTRAREESEGRRDGETQNLGRQRIGNRIKLDVGRTGTVGGWRSIRRSRWRTQWALGSI